MRVAFGVLVAFDCVCCFIHWPDYFAHHVDSGERGCAQGGEEHDQRA